MTKYLIPLVLLVGCSASDGSDLFGAEDLQPEDEAGGSYSFGAGGQVSVSAGGQLPTDPPDAGPLPPEEAGGAPGAGGSRLTSGGSPSSGGSLGSGGAEPSAGGQPGAGGASLCQPETCNPAFNTTGCRCDIEWCDIAGPAGAECRSQRLVTSDGRVFPCSGYCDTAEVTAAYNHCCPAPPGAGGATGAGGASPGSGGTQEPPPIVCPWQSLDCDDDHTTCDTATTGANCGACGKICYPGTSCYLAVWGDNLPGCYNQINPQLSPKY